MANYWYTLRDRSTSYPNEASPTNKTRKRKRDVDDSNRHLVCAVESPKEVAPTVIRDLLDQIRTERIARLFAYFDGDRNDVKAVRKYLPQIYKPFAGDLKKLKRQMASLYEINTRYEVSNIKEAPDCIGCLYDCEGQRDHMECPTGCLHTRTTCFVCDDSS